MSHMSTRKILLVDDSKSARYALRLLLQKHECEVDTAESAEIGLEKVSASLPDAIFMDHLMPGMNGFEALDVLKRNPRTAHIPVVMCTSNDDQPYQDEARSKGALGILPKPATPDKLAAVLAAIDAARVALPASAPPPAPAVPEAAPSPVAPPVDRETLAAMVQEELGRLLEVQVPPLVSGALGPLRSELSETLRQQVVAQWTQDKDEITESLWARSTEQLARLRQELTGIPAADTPAGAADPPQLEAAMQQLRGELLRLQTEHSQGLMQKLVTEVLPDLVQRAVHRQEQQVYHRLDLRLEELLERLAEQLPQNSQLLRRLAETAETAAEHKAAEVALSHAQDIAERTAETRAGEVTDTLLRSAHTALGRMYLLAGAAAAVGVLSSVAVFFLVH
jgi:CheY-like chemotaxis protein